MGGPHGLRCGILYLPDHDENFCFLESILLHSLPIDHQWLGPPDLIRRGISFMAEALPTLCVQQLPTGLQAVARQVAVRLGRLTGCPVRLCSRAMNLVALFTPSVP